MKKILIFSALLALPFLLNAQQTNITISATSTTLKTKMTAAGNYPAIMEIDAFYYNSNLCVAIGQNNNSRMRCVCNASNAFTDMVNINQSGAAKAWSKNELAQWLIQNYEVTNYTETTQGQNITVSFIVNGVQRTGTSNNDAEAIAAAIISML